MAKNKTSIEVLNSNLAFVQFGEEKRPELKRIGNMTILNTERKTTFHKS